MIEEFDELLDPVEETRATSSGRLRRVLARWWVILLFCLLGLAGGFYKYSITPAVQFTALGILEIPGIEQQLVGEEALRDKRGDLQKVNTLMSKLGGVSALTRVAESPAVQSLERIVPPVDSYKPRYMRPESELQCTPASSVPPAALRGMMGGWIELVQREGTAMVEVRVTHLDGETATILTQEIMQSYIDHEAVVKMGGTSTAFELVQDKAVVVAKDLEDLEKSLKIYEGALKLSAELSQNRVELAQLRSRYKEKHPKLIQAISINDDLFKRFQAEINYIAKSDEEASYWRPKMAEIKSLESRINLGGVSVPKVKQEWITLVQNSLAARESVLANQVRNKTEEYSTLTSRVSEIDLSDNADQNDVVIAEQAFVADVVRSGLVAPLILGAGIGMIVGIGIAFLLSLIDYKVYDVRSAEETTGLSCLAAIPDEKRVHDTKEGWEPTLVVDKDSAHAESFRNLRASIMLLGKREKNQVIMVTSAAPSEGKTTVSAELATSVALNDERTIIVDLDLRKPRLHQLFPEVKDKPGITELFSGQTQLSEIVHPTAISGLSVIGAGGRAPNPAELLSDNELHQLITALRNQYDRVIVDTPPVLPVADSRVLSRYVDKVMMVVRANYSPIGAILRAKQLLDEAKAPIAGIVVNALHARRSGASYMGYKGYGEYGNRGGYSYYSSEEK